MAHNPRKEFYFSSDGYRPTFSLLKYKNSPVFIKMLIALRCSQFEGWHL